LKFISVEPTDNATGIDTIEIPETHLAVRPGGDKVTVARFTISLEGGAETCAQGPDGAVCLRDLEDVRRGVRI